MAIEETDVLVVGGGPVGVSTAIELRRFGVECRVIEAEGARPEGSRALTLHARTLELLALRGDVDRFVEQGRRVRRIRLTTGGRRESVLDFTQIRSAFPYVLVLPQVETEKVLEGQLHEVGGAVERDHRLTALEYSGDCVEATTLDSKGGEARWRAQWLVSADGAHSAVRQLLGAPTVGEREGHRYLGADLMVDRAMDDIRLVWSDHGFGVLVPFRDGSYRVAVSSLANTSSESKPSLSEIQKHVDRIFPWKVQLSNPTWVTSLHSGHRQLLAYRHGRVLFAGDAAHTHNPAGGQGMNIGLHDSFSLGWRLASVVKEVAPESLLDDYHRERHPAAARVLKSTERSMRLAQTRSPLLQLVRRHVVHRAPALVRRRITEQTAGLFDRFHVPDREAVGNHSSS